MTAEKTVNILHLTDLHFKVDRLYDQEVVLKALLDDVQQQSKLIGQPDLIVFSGDLVHSADDEKVYDKLYDQFIEQLLRLTNCDHSRLFLTPGNHDLHRSVLAQNSKEQQSFEKLCTERDSLNKQYLNGKAARFARKKSEAFFDFADFFEPSGKIYCDEIVSAYDLPELGISLVSLNTAWLGWAGHEGRIDLQKLMVPEAAISKIIAQIPENRYIVFNFHHPLNWHSEFAGADFKDLSEKRANLYLYGHVHDPRPQIIGGDGASLVHNQAGALYTWRQDRYLGYSMIRIAPSLGFTKLEWRSYFDRRRAFDIATNVNDNKGIAYSSSQARSHFEKLLDVGRLASIDKWIKEEVLPAIVEESSDGILDKPTTELFVAPPLARVIPTHGSEMGNKGDFLEEEWAFPSIVNDESNILFEAYPEHGKTALLKQFCLEVAKKTLNNNSGQHAIPVFLQFKDFTPGTRKIEKAIRDNIPRLPEGCELDVLLGEGCFTICVDDIPRVFEHPKKCLTF